MFSSGARANCTVAAAASVIYITGTRVSGVVQTVKGLPFALSSIIQEEAGAEAEIIFGAVHDPELEKKVRVTVIATGFEDGFGQPTNVLRPDFRRPERTPTPRRQPARERSQEAETRTLGWSAAEGEAQPPGREAEEKQRAVAGGVALPLSRYPERAVTREQIGELDIPTFIRRQMD